MPRRKEIITTAIEGAYFLPAISYADFLKFKDSPETRIIGRIRPVVNDVAVPDLLNRWRDHVLQYFPRTLTAAEQAKLESVLTAYTRARIARLHPIAWNDLLSRLKNIAVKSRALLDELNDHSPAYTIAWSEISREAQQRHEQMLSHDDVYPILSRLHGASFHALESAKRNRSAGQKGDWGEPWVNLVSGLRGLFEAGGGCATAANNLRDGSYAKPSPFVKLVWAVMSEAIPKDLREHTQTQGAMAREISRARSKGRDARSDGRNQVRRRSK